MANYKTYRIGDVVELCTETNSDLKYGLEHVRGISNTKEIQQTKANLIERNLAPFHVVRRNEFVYNRRTSRNGERVGLGFNNTDETLLITEDYVHFRVKDENQLNPDYLYLFFKRDEFDREARYNSWGSATEFFNWDDMQAIKINVPPIEEQRRIVSEYQTVERRIQNNELLIKKLEETAQAIYHHTFVGSIDEKNLPEGWKKEKLFDVASIIYGFPFDSEQFNNTKIGIPLIRIRDILLNDSDTYTTEIVDEKYFINNGEILIGMDGAFHMTIWSGKPSYQNQRTVRIISDKRKELSELQIYIAIQPIIKSLEASIEGTTVAHLSDKHMKDISILIAPPDIQSKTNRQLRLIQDYLLQLKSEIIHLRSLQSLLTSKLS